MPGNVPLARTSSRLSGAGSPDALHDARRDWFWLWDLYYVLVCAVVSLLVVHAARTPSDAILTCGCILALLAWYALVGRPAILAGDQGSRGVVFVIGLVLILGLAVWVVPMSAYLLFVACPMAFMALPLVWALVAVVVLNAIPVAAAQLQSSDGARAPLSTAALALGFTVLAGTYLDRTIRTNHERARLIAELQERRQEVERLSREAGAAAERARLAGEIHDTLAQGFASVVTLTQAALGAMDREPQRAQEHLDLVLRTARENLTEARALVAGRSPAALEDGTLSDAIDRLVDGLSAATGSTVGWETSGSARTLPLPVEVLLLRTAQEAMTNIRRHAGARHVQVRLRYDESSVTLVVADDGRGFDETADDRQGYGLEGMAARATQLGADLTIRSSRGAGTSVTLEVPA
ncbi:sensor histidine kinase [Cellulomonas fengjieae]|uniref:histidine kinase n=1 Tax=Cellulomonas fengjieae TaxID=2819978 RepID=A0ABS3SLG0_9CELL|nr:sensor histidine kinase [Cellulomonas fengjieae]MBO3086581.1 sensor histidine kinase [Cellulomonas fengjieae]QVI66566.1 sensor histidine kinase [Cellulomonas fengjieae]